MGQHQGYSEMSLGLTFTDQLRGELEVSIVSYVANEGSLGPNKLSKSIEIKTDQSVGLLSVSTNFDSQLKPGSQHLIHLKSQLEYSKLLWYFLNFVDS